MPEGKPNTATAIARDTGSQWWFMVAGLCLSFATSNVVDFLPKYTGAMMTVIAGILLGAPLWRIVYVR